MSTLTTKDIQSYITEIKTTMDGINNKTNRIRSFTLLYLVAVMRSRGFNETEIVDCLSQ